MLEERPSQSGAEPVLRGTGAPTASRPRRATARLKGAWAGVYRDPVTWAIVVTVFGAYCALSLFRLLQLTPASWDLGIYTEYVKQYAHLGPPVVDIRGAGVNLLGDHFQPIVAVIAPFFRVFPSAATLLVAQALLIAVSVFPVSQLAREKLGTGPGRAIAIGYGLSWGLQQLIAFDFHEIAFAVPLLAFALSALARGHLKAAAWWALPLVFVKEDQGFTVAAIGLYMIISALRPNAPRLSPPTPDPEDADARLGSQAGPGPADLGFRLVVSGYRPDHPALQPGPSLCLLERRRNPGARRPPDRDRPGQAVPDRVARQAPDDRDDGFADRVHRAEVAAGADRGAEPAAALPVDGQQLLGHAVAL